MTDDWCGGSVGSLLRRLCSPGGASHGSVGAGASGKGDRHIYAIATGKGEGSGELLTLGFAETARIGAMLCMIHAALTAVAMKGLTSDLSEVVEVSRNAGSVADRQTSLIVTLFAQHGRPDVAGAALAVGAAEDHAHVLWGGEEHGSAMPVWCK